MTTDEVLAVLNDRGLSVVLDPAGQPVLKGDLSQVTPRLLRVLKIHRDEILRRQKANGTTAAIVPATSPPEAPQTDSRRQFLWRFGHVGTEQEGDTRFRDLDHYPAGAWWWRLEGEQGWRTVPGRNQANMPPPEGETLA